MNPEKHGRARARSEAAQTYHAMLAALYEHKPKPFQYVPVAGFPFRENLCREVALLACSELEAEDTRLVFEFLGLEEPLMIRIERIATFNSESAESVPCSVSDDCDAIVHVFECPRNSA